jgi:hypothetical protein
VSRWRALFSRAPASARPALRPPRRGAFQSLRLPQSSFRLIRCSDRARGSREPDLGDQAKTTSERRTHFSPCSTVRCRNGPAIVPELKAGRALLHRHGQHCALHEGVRFSHAVSPPRRCEQDGKNISVSRWRALFRARARRSESCNRPRTESRSRAPASARPALRPPRRGAFQSLRLSERIKRARLG